MRKRRPRRSLFVKKEEMKEKEEHSHASL